MGWQKVEGLRSGSWSLPGIIISTASPSVFIGGDFLGEKGKLDKERGVFGLRYLLPYNIHSRLWVDSDLGGRLELGKVWDLTPRLALYGNWKYDTHEFW